MDHPISSVRFLTPISVSLVPEIVLPGQPTDIRGAMDLVSNTLYLDNEEQLKLYFDIPKLKKDILQFIKQDNYVDPSVYSMPEDFKGVEQKMQNPMGEI